MLRLLSKLLYNLEIVSCYLSYMMLLLLCMRRSDMEVGNYGDSQPSYREKGKNCMFNDILSVQQKRRAAMMMIWSDKRRCVVSLYFGVCATISFSHFLVLRRSYQIFKTARTQCTMLWSEMKIVFHSARPFSLPPVANVIVLDMLWHSKDDCQWQMEWHNMHKRKTFNRLSYKVKSTWRLCCALLCICDPWSDVFRQLHQH